MITCFALESPGTKFTCGANLYSRFSEMFSAARDINKVQLHAVSSGTGLRHCRCGDVRALWKILFASTMINESFVGAVNLCTKCLELSLINRAWLTQRSTATWCREFLKLLRLRRLQCSKLYLALRKLSINRLKIEKPMSIMFHLNYNEKHFEILCLPTSCWLINLKSPSKQRRRRRRNKLTKNVKNW